MNLAERISKLSLEQKKLLELKLKQQPGGIDVLHIPITKENRENLDSTGWNPVTLRIIS